MKKGLITIGLGVLMMSCTNAKLVQYNTDRLDNSKEYRSLEKEADAWLEEQQ